MSVPSWGINWFKIVNLKFKSVVFFLAIVVGGLSFLTACGQPKMERCRLNEVEPREIELNLRDSDIEGWELEILCGDKLWDIPWGELNKNFSIDIKKYYSKDGRQAEKLLQDLSRRLTFYKAEDDNKKFVFGSLDGNGELIRIKANRDD